jgi:hypothetical protein
MSVLRRFSGPAIGFLVGAGLQVSGIEAFPVALAIWGVAALWGLLALITLPQVAKWLPAIAITWPAFHRSTPTQALIEPAVTPAKGFIDFLVDAQQAGKKVPILLTQLNDRTTDMAQRLPRHSKRFADAAGNAQKLQGAASDAAKDIDRYSAFVEDALPELRATLKLFAEGWTGYFETSPEARDNSKKHDIEVFRGTLQGLQKTTRSSRESIAAFRNSTLGLRQRNVSQKLNAAADRLANGLSEVVSVMKDLEGAFRRLAGLAAKRLEEMAAA